MIKMIFNSSSLIMEFTTLIDQKLCVGLCTTCAAPKAFSKTKFNLNESKFDLTQRLWFFWNKKVRNGFSKWYWVDGALNAFIYAQHEFELQRAKKKWKNTWNDKVVFYPTLNPHFSPCLECRTRSLDLEKVLYTVKWLLYHDIWPFIKIFESDLSITWLSLIKISSFRCTTEVCV